MTSHEITLFGYLAFVVAGVILNILGLRPGSRIPTLGTAVSRLMRTRSGRVGVIAGWAWLALHFFAR